MPDKLSELVVLIRGGGEIASGIAHRLFRSHIKVCMVEIEKPQAIRREVSFCEAIYEGYKEVEGVEARFITSYDQVAQTWANGHIPILIDPQAVIKKSLKPDVLIDSILAKKNLGTQISDAPLVIGVGPGFRTGKNVHIAIETNRGHNLGKIVVDGATEPNTGIPANIDGFSSERVLYAPAAGTFLPQKNIGDLVKAGELVAVIDSGYQIKAKINGVIRGLLRNGSTVHQGMKVADIDARGKREYCYTISDKARAIAGGVLEAILTVFNK